VIAVVLVGATYGAVVIADNSLPRATWRMALAVAWGLGGIAAIIALVTAGAVAGGIVR
jgi:alpha-D-ribose 1-methylphosphonate 5-phosphate C-P lyase